MANPTELFISEYIEGSSNNKAIEIFNGTGAAIDLAAAGYSLQFFFNGSSSAGLTINLTGTVAAGDVFVIANSSAAAEILAQADQTNGAGWYNGDDAIVLRKGSTVIDSIGQVGFDPGSEWGTGLLSTADNTLQRKSSITSGDINTGDAYDPSTDWVGFANNTFDGLGSHSIDGGGSPILAISAFDASAAEEGADPGVFRISRTGDTTTDLVVSYTIGGNASAADFTPALTGTVMIPAGAASVDITITPVDDADIEGNETLVLTLQPLAGYDLGASEATVTIIDNDAGAMKISAIQGSGGTSPMVGSLVTVEAIVVGDFQGASGLNGFYLQEEDADADGNPLTSEGVFVFQGSINSTEVQIGDKVSVTGVVTEFSSSGSSLTELGSISSVTVLASGQPLPTAATVNLPVATLAELEAVEGMRIQVPDTLTVSNTFGLSRYGEVLLAADGLGNEPGTDARIDQYTQFHDPSVSGNAAYQTLQTLRSIVLDDGLGIQNPATVYARDGLPLSADNTLRGGDTVTGLTGVLDERFGGYRVQPTAPVDFEATNPRTEVPDVGGTLQVASLNVLNFFNGNGLGGGFPTSRGADSAFEFGRQLDKIVSAILGTGAEVVGLLEIENDGYGANSAIQYLVNSLNDVAGAGTWAFVNPGVSVLGGDEIAVGMIYQPAVVAPVGAAAILDSSVDARFNSAQQRPTLAQTFEVIDTGAIFTPVINHLKSKGSSAGGPGDADANDGQGFSNGTRTAAAQALVDWLDNNPTGHGDGDYLVMGDLNAYAMEDPITAIRAGADDTLGTADDYTNLIPDSTYSYSFDGQWGALDHALGSASLVEQVAGATKWHINADEPVALDYNVEFKSAAQLIDFYGPDAYRASDHDPVIVGLNLGATFIGTARGELIEGTPGPDVIRAGQGRDVVVGGGGNDHFVFTSLLDFFDTIADFSPGHDVLDISALMSAVGAGGADPVGGGYLQTMSLPSFTALPGITADIAHTLVLFDPDGSAGPAAARLMVELVGVNVSDPGVLLGIPS
jgi:uncharacterized protein